MSNNKRKFKKTNINFIFLCNYARDHIQPTVFVWTCEYFCQYMNLVIL